MTTPYAAGPVRSAYTPVVLFPARKRRREAASRNLVIVSAGTGVPLRLATGSPALMSLAVEDLCWQLAVAEMEARRPRGWHRAKRVTWSEERSCLEAERERLAARAREAISEL